MPEKHFLPPPYFIGHIYSRSLTIGGAIQAVIKEIAYDRRRIISEVGGFRIYEMK
jgi:hypothetical protein